MPGQSKLTRACRFIDTLIAIVHPICDPRVFHNSGVVGVFHVDQSSPCFLCNVGFRRPKYAAARLLLQDAM
jgi:hypothetical protein